MAEVRGSTPLGSTLEPPRSGVVGALLYGANMCSLSVDSASLSTNRKGNIAEAAVAFHAARLGIEVFRPLFEHGRYDLVLELDGELLRVQCKWAQLAGEYVRIKISGSRYTPSGYVKSTYSVGEIDAVAAYCADLDRCYLLPAELVTNKTAIQLRQTATKNGQLAGLNWAKDYELERFASAGPKKAPFAVEPVGVPPSDGLIVGAHEFRGKFGYYMELAGKGAEIKVSRWGKPSVKLVPDGQLPLQ